jgi:hypothetical protein
MTLALPDLDTQRWTSTSSSEEAPSPSPALAGGAVALVASSLTVTFLKHARLLRRGVACTFGSAGGAHLAVVKLSAQEAKVAGQGGDPRGQEHVLCILRPLSFFPLFPSPTHSMVSVYPRRR